MVISLLALFVALGGGAYAAVALKKNSVKAKQIAPNAVKASEIAANAVGSSEIAANAVNGSKVAANALNGTDIDEGTLVRVAYGSTTAGLIAEATDTEVARLGNTGGGGSGVLNTSSFPTANHRIIVNASANLFPDGGTPEATHFQCKLQSKIGGGSFTDMGFANAEDLSMTAPAGGADDHSIALTGFIEGPKNSSVDVRMTCNPFNDTANVVVIGLTAIAVPAA
jgi:hypothetical protein